MAAPLASALDRFGADLVPVIPGRYVVPVPLRAVVTAGIARRLRRPVLAIVAAEREAEDLAEDIALFGAEVAHLPAWETLPFEHVSPSVATMARRIEARHFLDVGRQGVVVASVRAVTQRVSPTPVAPLVVQIDDEHAFDGLVATLVEHGFARTGRVEAHGEFAVRGGIIDVWPAQAANPLRIDFWGDIVEDIRDFDVASQRSQNRVDRVTIYPAAEVLIDEAARSRAAELRSIEPWATSTWDRIAEGISFPGIESWLPWLAEERTILDGLDADVILFDPVRCADRAGDLIKEEADLAGALSGTWGTGSPNPEDHPALYLPLDLDSRALEAPPLAAGPGDPGYEARGFDAVPGDAASVAKALNEWRIRGVDVVVAMDGDPAARRVAALLAEDGADLPVVDRVEKLEPCVLPIGIHQGFVFPAIGVGVVGEREVAGRRRSHRRPGRVRGGGGGDAYRDLKAGDFVVHHHHGIGRFEGLVHRDIAGVERDYLLIAFAGADRIYVPTDQLAAVRRYTGGETPRLSRMGGTDWSQTRSKVRQAVSVIAQEVVDLHRERAAARGHMFPADSPWQTEFEAAFPYEETPDQIVAIAEVKQDMESEAPMDRLVFGDVGFGKTEVALRAAFKAVQDGKQAALLVPTTLLAQQHLATLEDRFAPYPIRVEMLSRFLTTAQQRTVVAGLADGSVDVVVGTHRILSKDIAFKDLGLLVIDEEQRTR